MLFNSPVFIFVFLPLVFFGFHALRATRHFQLFYAFLLASSLFYYAWWNPVYIILILGSIGFNYTVGRALERARAESRRLILTGGLAVNLGVLGFFKYKTFLFDNLEGLGSFYDPFGPVLLPLGISFFTLQQITYLVDTYRGQRGPDTLVSYALFVTFFPQLIAGPIVHHGEMVPQFRDTLAKRNRGEDLGVGLSLFAYGLFKKTVVADTLAYYSQRSFELGFQPDQIDPMTAWMAAISFSFQVYYDFSAYSDMAMGLGRMFGLQLPLNFNSPYRAVSIRDYWRRWHMTLSRFLRDYLYIPFGGNQGGAGRVYFNLLAVMLLGGLWHGAGWTFVLWGAMHGVMLCVNHGWSQFRAATGHDPRQHGWPSYTFGWALTFFFVVLSRVLFRSENLTQAGHIFAAMFDFSGGLALSPHLAALWQGLALDTLIPVRTSFQFTDHDLIFFWVFAGILVLWTRFAPNPQQVFENYAPGLESSRRTLKPNPWPWLRWKPTWPWALATGFIAFLALRQLFAERQTEFIYFNF